ncbi:hypothetical protein P3X46_022463 [Hevea brasiliensis]|uniref:Uncharacterized protein n=1 Tax=Hevea brasiliensis TaxID=3981 RepID=A0ABQ9L9K5_HEVBR|nr:hypothetical protein P3X46_022463 [Hevea brasiliensis]
MEEAQEDIAIFRSGPTEEIEAKLQLARLRVTKDLGKKVNENFMDFEPFLGDDQEWKAECHDVAQKKLSFLASSEVDFG